MNKELFINFIARKSGSDFVNNELISAVIDELFTNRVGQDTPVEDVLRLLSERSKLLLTGISPTVEIRFRGVDVSRFHPIRDELIRQLDQLTS